MNRLWDVIAVLNAIMAGWNTLTGDYGFAVFCGLISVYCSIQAGSEQWR